jgi:uncharacterized membrane protein
MKQSRWDSPVLWGAIVAQVLSILVLTGVIDVSQSQSINVVVAAILQMLVAFGVINDPTSKNTL